MLDDRLVSGDGGWFFRVRGGNLVGPYGSRIEAAQAAEHYRDECQARVRGQDVWRLWRKARSAAPAPARPATLRPTGT